MARNTFGRGWAYRDVEKCHCGGLAAKWSVYSQRMVCNRCLSLERAVVEAQEARQAAEAQAEAIADAAELAGILQAEYRDEADTRRDLLAGLHW